MEALSIHVTCESIHLVVHVTTTTAENSHLGPLLPIFFPVLGYLAEGRKYRATVSKAVQAEVSTPTPVLSFRRNFPKHNYTAGLHIQVRTVGSSL